MDESHSTVAETYKSNKYIITSLRTGNAALDSESLYPKVTVIVTFGI